MNVRVVHDYVPSTKISGKKTLIVPFIVTIITCVSTATPHNHALVSTEPAVGSALHERINKAVRDLEYSNTIAHDFIDMVSDWKDAQGRSVLSVLNEMLGKARQAYREGTVSQSQLAKIEEYMIMTLGRIIRDRIIYEGDCFDLPEIVESNAANCLGYSQLLCVLGNSISLSVRPANLRPEHIANVLLLSDGTMTVVDLTSSEGFVSERIIVDSRFQGSGSHWKFEDKGNLVRNNKTIHILGRNELIGEMYFCRGIVSHMSGRGTKAISEYDNAIEFSPQCAKIYNNRGSAYLALGRYTEAIPNFNQALELDPRYGSAYHNRANAYLALGQYGLAILDYTNTLELNPNFAKTYVGRGHAYLAEGYYGRAVSDYTKAIGLQPNFARPYYTRAIGYAYLAQHERARRDMLQAMKLDRTLKMDIEDMSAKLRLNLKGD